MKQPTIKPARSKPDTPAIRYCSMPNAAERGLPPGLDPIRVAAILATQDKWLNGTVIHYYFFDRDSDGQMVLLADGQQEWRSWKGSKADIAVVRKAFQGWADLGIGLTFQEVTDRSEAEVRIGFMSGDGSWSYLGTQVLQYGPDQRTMNFGWSLAGPDGADTALHEIGHTLGLPHEHQNPYAGIVWNEEAVYAELAKPPNEWKRDVTHYNIIRKIRSDSVQGSYWDPNSIMHYPFAAGLIQQPAGFEDGLQPAGGLSSRDSAWVRSFYPPLGDDEGMLVLEPSRSQELAVRQGEQQNFLIRPPATRTYDMRTFGATDTAMGLFEKRDGQWRFVAEDDDSGEGRNASLQVRLIKGQLYALRIRLKYSDTTSAPTVMLW